MEKYETVYKCPICGEIYSDYDQAKECLIECATQDYSVIEIERPVQEVDSDFLYESWKENNMED